VYYLLTTAYWLPCWLFRRRGLRVDGLRVPTTDHCHCLLLTDHCL